MSIGLLNGVENPLYRSEHDGGTGYGTGYGGGYSESSPAGSGYSGALAKSSGYGHGGHSSGYGHSGGYDDHKEEECCSLVVDLICLAAILGALAAATVLLGRVIQIEIMGLGRKRSFMSFVDNVTYPSWLVSGESSGNIVLLLTATLTIRRCLYLVLNCFYVFMQPIVKCQSLWESSKLLSWTNTVVLLGSNLRDIICCTNLKGKHAQPTNCEILHTIVPAVASL
jgi:hypothetical protein